jgi:hypothetical protein
MFARIYQPTKNAMQSGHRNAGRWVLDFEGEKAREIDPLMGWTSSSDMRGQVRLEFESKEAAISYAKEHNIPVQVADPKLRQPKNKVYSDNFKADRVHSWTH